MPIQVTIDEKEQWIFPKADWSTVSIKGDDITIDKDFYIKSNKL
jgi:hypothetical protein